MNCGVEFFRGLSRDPRDYNGHITISRTEGMVGPPIIEVHGADPRIRVDHEVAYALIRSGYLTDGPDGFEYLRIPARNMTVVYRFVGYDFLRCQHLAEWPD